MNPKVKISIGICAYNEEKNIEQAIRSAYSQNTDNFEIAEIIVVSSGSTDRTDEIVSGLTSEFENLVLLSQASREGKNSAINLFLDNKTAPIAVLLNADNTLGNSDTLNNLIKPFSDSDVGIVGGRPVPTNGLDTLTGFASNMLWTMHHHVSMRHPKIGELMAFRDIGTRLPYDAQSDEDILRMKLEEKGYLSDYAPEAVVYNRGPETISDFLKQRIRVNIGERYMKKNYDYDIPTWNSRLLVYAFIDTVKDLGFHPIKITGTVCIEAYSRLKSALHVKSGKSDSSIWDPVTTTKKL